MLPIFMPKVFINNISIIHLPAGILGLHQPTLLPEWEVPRHGFSGVSLVIKMEQPIDGRSEQAIYNLPIFNSCPVNVR